MKTLSFNPRGAGRRASVRDLLDSPGDQKVLERLEQLREETRLAQELTLMRTRAGLTQAQLAAKLGCSQGRISKIESSRDADLTIGVVQEYARATQSDFGVKLIKPWNNIIPFKARAATGRKKLASGSRG